MITPRTTRLVRVPDLRALHQAVADRIALGSPDARGLELERGFIVLHGAVAAERMDVLAL